MVVSSRRKENVAQAVTKLHSDGLLEVAGVTCHVGKSEDRINLFKTAAEKFGGIDILVSNAAANPAVGSVLEVRSQLIRFM